LYGYYPEVVIVDQIYLTRANRKYLKQKGIRHTGPKLGRPTPESAYERRKRRKERNMRNHVEGKFGQGKNAYGLDEIRARRQDTSEAWLGGIFLAMNLTNLMKMLGILLILAIVVADLFFDFILSRCKPWNGRRLEGFINGIYNLSMNKLNGSLIQKKICSYGYIRSVEG
jgi:hypothetical protein